MLDVFNIAKPQNCDIQTFNVNNLTGSGATTQTWVKPRGVSNVYMLLIGAGGNGNGITGGGSGGVTVWYGSAQNVPDILYVVVTASADTRVNYRGSGGFVVLLQATAASGATAGTAYTANQFAASGFFQSIAGQAGVAGAVSASSTTFLSGGGNTGNNVTANYGYSVTSDSPGYFLINPLIVGVGGSGNNKGGVGCGGGGGVTNTSGGPGMVLIASW